MRVQGMRWESHGWDPKGPASIHRARAALDRDGAMIGYAFESKGFSRVDIETNESDPVYSLAGQLMGLPLKPLQGGDWRLYRTGTPAAAAARMSSSSRVASGKFSRIASSRYAAS